MSGPENRLRKMLKRGQYVYQCTQGHIFKSEEIWINAFCEICKTWSVDFYLGKGREKVIT